MNKGKKVGKYWFSADVPEEVINSCESSLIKHEHLIPSWCNEVRIYWDAQGVDSDTGSAAVAAYIETSYPYRYAAISICPAFLSEEPEDRDIRIRHELCHIISSPLVSYVKDIAEIIGTNEILGQLVNREITEKAEAMTEDLAQIVTKIETLRETKSTKK